MQLTTVTNYTIIFQVCLPVYHSTTTTGLHAHYCHAVLRGSSCLCIVVERCDLTVIKGKIYYLFILAYCAELGINVLCIPLDQLSAR